MDFLVGTFYSSKLFTIRFEPESRNLEITNVSETIGGHSWLCLSDDHKYLYTTVWAEPPAVAAYAILPDHTLEFLNSKPVRAMSGYVCASTTHLYSAGGPTGEVFALDPDGSIGDLAQNLDFRSKDGQNDGKTGEVAHGDFGGLRHGAHSIDLSPDRKSLYIADIGHNCVWTYSVSPQGTVDPVQKWIASRPNDGPRHCWPHPNGKILYSVQEHSSMVDVLSVDPDGTSLHLLHGVKIIPKDKDPKNYWADEVRLSRPISGTPRYLYASTRGLERNTKGYVAVFPLDDQGDINGEEALHIFETATSGGIANAVEPMPMREGDEMEYLVLTDSQEGWVFVLAFDGVEIGLVGRVRLVGEGGKGLAAATAVWL